MTHETDGIELLRALAGNSQHSQAVTIHGGATSLIVSLVAVFAIVVSLAAVAVIWAWRETDLRDMAQIRARLMQCEQYREQHSRRISELESRDE